MNMREKIAMAISIEEHGTYALCWEAYLGAADAVLEAIREPTGGMIEAGYGEHNNGSPRDRYTAMIDAARRGSDDQ